MRSQTTLLRCICLLVLIMSIRGVRGQDLPDHFMGDWQGTVTTADNMTRPIVAQVLALGKGQYKATLLQKFDTREPTLATLDGKLENETVIFAGGATNDGTIFTGPLLGKNGERFRLTPVTRLSPTFGAAPPEGAVVLLDGSNLDQWNKAKSSYGIIDLRKVYNGGENCVAYLRNSIQSPEDQDAILEIGSDDGVKAWFNGTVIHVNNVPRPCVPGQDKVKISLRKGWNDLMLKIMQGGGGWAAHARIVGDDGKPLENLSVRYAIKDVKGKPLTTLGQRTDGTILSWEAAGPGIQEGKRGMQLVDVVFLPEDPTAKDVEWKKVDAKEVPRKEGWKLLDDGAMEVVPKAGSMWTKELFSDFKLHLEFRTPFMPEARGQGRGNSGVYLQGRYEVQVLDSYALEGKDNECGGIYKVAAPRVNMCAPPGQWQTYDITFRAPRFENEKLTENARLTVLHNGVMIHENLEIPGPTGGGGRSNLDKPGPLLLQDHGNKVQYRNIWILPTK